MGTVNAAKLHQVYRGAREHQRKSRLMKVNYHYPQCPITFLKSTLTNQLYFSFIKLRTFRPISPESNDSDLFYVEQSLGEPSPCRPNSPFIPTSTEMSGKNTQEIITLSCIASPEPQIVMIDSDPNEPTLPYGFGRQLPIIPPGLKDLNLPLNPFNIPTSLAISQPAAEGHDENCSPQSPEPSDPSPIFTPR